MASTFLRSPLTAAALLLALGALSGCSSLDRQYELESKNKRINKLSAQVTALSEENQMLLARQGELSGERDQLSERVAKLERRNTELVEQVSTLAKRRLEEQQRDRQAKALAAARAREEERRRAAAAEAAAREAAEAEARARAAAETQAREAALVNAPKTPSDDHVNYYLRIISLPENARNEQVIARLARHLEANEGLSNIRTHVYEKHWVIDIGPFSSKTSDDAVTLRDRVRELRYQGRKDFVTSYFTRYPKKDPK